MLNQDELDLLATRLFMKLQPHMVNATPKWLPLNEACRYAGDMGRAMMTSLIDEGHVYAKRLNYRGKIVVDRESIDSFLNSDRLVV